MSSGAARAANDEVAADSYLSVYLAPFIGQLGQADVTDIYVNRPGEIWIERLGGRIACEPAPDLTEGLLWRLARQVASLSNQGISRAEPLLSARLPDGSRVQVIAPPATRGPLALAIRKHVSSNLALDDYVAAGAFEGTSRGEPTDTTSDRLREHYIAGDWPRLLAEAVRGRRTIMVSGGTSTGKTTFLNALLREIGETERLLFIEDTPELQMRHANAVGLVSVRGELGETKVSAEDLLIASLRMRPDRIILGELRGKEAATFLRAINTGHPGSLTTIHANSPRHAIDQLALLASQGLAMDRNDAADYIRATVDVIVQLKHEGGKRSVASILMPMVDGT
ncbi:P-type DNA transfer ATPase VirB11 [Qipengyuania sp. 6B39]|uniref:P-type DNA transfer ATPase VirB11 n=1 Tax=Qipengyuania proteolytica TaxID=2867239 RepID=UPI001C89C4E3|nr:P-type DNA transfer ATPase VirB11 [Qipengyuania proteolytica]MBX7494869.1 P-type DNA transfer ATPase VirB11 [Qipengyuania proteolytica]